MPGAAAADGGALPGAEGAVGAVEGSALEVIGAGTGLQAQNPGTDLSW